MPEQTRTTERSELTTETLSEYSDSELQELRDQIAEELEHRKRNVDLDAAESVDLVTDQYVSWQDLSAHPNPKAVKPWILRVTGTHDKYGVDGDWLNKQKIDGTYHMDVTPLGQGDIIRVSGASHKNTKHRYYRVLAVTDGKLYYETEYGLDEAEVIEEVG
jgi:hypothetical protein